MEQSICRRNKYGYCKHGDKCHFKHEKQICIQSNCTVFSCKYRHPRLCKWFEEYGRCKFSTFCKFRHEKFESIENLAIKIKEHEVKLSDINKKLETIEKEEQNIQKTIDEYEVRVEKRFQELEKKISLFEKLLKERDGKISTLESCLKEINMILEKESKSKGSKTINNSKQIFKCEFCEFSTNSKNGLKTHKARKHTNYSEGTQIIKCEFCDEEFKLEKELKEHMISHSYRESDDLKYKCDECEFWGPNEFSMKTHFKRLHCETISCGMCDFQAANLEILDTHTFTCEMFRCDSCKDKFFSLSDIKKHIDKEHKGYSSLRHFYRWTTREDFYTERFHWSRDLFKQQKVK